MCSTEITERLNYIEKSFRPPLLNWSNIIQMKTPNSHSLIGPNCIVPIGQNWVFWWVNMEPFWLVSKDANEYITVQVQLERERSWSHWLSLDIRSTVQEAWQLSLWLLFFLRCSVCERSLYPIAARLWLWIWARLTTRSSWQVYAFSGMRSGIKSSPLCHRKHFLG